MSKHAWCGLITAGLLALPMTATADPPEPASKPGMMKAKDKLKLPEKAKAPGEAKELGKAPAKKGKEKAEAKAKEPDSPEAAKKRGKGAEKMAGEKGKPDGHPGHGKKGDAKAQREAARTRIAAIAGDKPMTPALKQELTRHARRMARLERITTLATEKGDAKRTKRAAALVVKEQARHDKWMSGHAAQKPEGAEKPEKVEGDKKPKDEKAKPVIEEDHDDDEMEEE